MFAHAEGPFIFVAQEKRDYVLVIDARTNQVLLPTIRLAARPLAIGTLVPHQEVFITTEAGEVVLVRIDQLLEQPAPTVPANLTDAPGAPTFDTVIDPSRLFHNFAGSL
jgi:hypothetical protein